MSRRTVVVFLAGIAAMLLLASCASSPATIPPGLSAVEIFQRAQDASDRGNYRLAIRYYSLISADYPDDLNHVVWADYEIAFLYHKMGRNRTAVDRFNALLELYKTEGDKLPAAPRVLAQKVKARLEPLLKPST